MSRTTSEKPANILPNTLGEGVRLGLFYARTLLLHAAVVAIVFFITSMANQPAEFTGAAPKVLLQLLWICGGYITALVLAGAILGALAQLPRGILWYSLTGALLGGSIYGAIGVASELMEPGPANWKMVRSFTVVMAAVWGIAGLGFGLVQALRRK